MPFDTLRLPASAIADLYKNSLVVLDDVHQTPSKNKLQPATQTLVAAIAEPTPLPVVPPPAPKPAIRYAGGFGKKISIVVNHPSGDRLPATEMEILQKLMAACKLLPDDFAIINTAINQPAAQELWQLMPAKAMLLFGVGYNEIGLSFTRAFFQPEQWNEAWLMSAPPLSQFLGADTPELKVLKRELWNGLQKIFLGK